MKRTGERERENHVEAALREHYFSSYPAGYVDTKWGENDLQNHLWRRLQSDRTIVVPWLNGIKRLSGAQVLEIGCGTGSSTVALAECGANVTAVDVDEPSLGVARERCRAYGIAATMVLANAGTLPLSIRSQPFDMVIFYASLEHMTIEERLDAITTTWTMLPAGGLWCIIETPNRLWYFDWHTSLLPFFMWLPDEIAFQYSRFSDRPRFKDVYGDQNAEAMLHFRRRGRGVSFHELEVTLGRLNSLDVAGWLDWHARTSSWWQRWKNAVSSDAQYLRVIRRIASGVPEPFLQPRLDVAIRKTGREVR